jgi:hypothetical protein
MVMPLYTSSVALASLAKVSEACICPVMAVKSTAAQAVAAVAAHDSVLSWVDDSSHAPLLAHGVLEHSLSSTLQCSPDQPSSQTQV